MERIDPRLLAIAGAAFLSLSAIFVRVSGVEAGTAAFYRCLLALPILIPLALREKGGRRRPGLDLLAGAFLGLDLVFWGEAINRVGAGMATVLVNVQVVVLPLLALIVFRERPGRRFALALPLMLVGVAFAGARTLGADSLAGIAYGAGAGVLYAGYLFLTRVNGRDQDHRFRPLLLATVAAGAMSGLAGEVDVTPGWPALGWLAALAMSGQVCGWLLIGAALPRMRTETGGTLLLLQPILAVLLGAALLAERPTLLQLGGCALVIVAVWVTTRSTSVEGDAPAPVERRRDDQEDPVGSRM
ncbi:DMT family transporter [Spirillospora sp. CA-294931]|uniref:DMT family transporter n=1 Tax=Spirillospora sp. CA-294931 TaxID=3240042 RepID=UPI003D8E2032